MKILTSDLKTDLLRRVAGDQPRKVWTASDFADLGSRDAIDKALQRLVKGNALRRVDRGLYDRPSLNSLTGEPSAPDPRAVIEAVSRREQARMLIDGMTAANDVGLSDAVPAKIVVHTDARLRPIALGKVTITFRPTAASKLYWAGRPAMRIVQALHWLRETLKREGEPERVKRRLAELLSEPEQGDVLRDDLAEGLASLPAWMQDFLRPLIGTDAAGSGQDRAEIPSRRARSVAR